MSTTILPAKAVAPLVASAPGHVANVRSHVVDALTPGQIGQLGRIADALLERLDLDGHMTGP